MEQIKTHLFSFPADNSNLNYHDDAKMPSFNLDFCAIIKSLKRKLNLYSQESCKNLNMLT